MAGSVNKVILVGHLGKDPEVKHFDKGASVAKFSLATTESYKDKAGNKVDQTEWHNIEVWGELAKIAEQYLKKGKLVYLEGSLKTDSWEDNGVKKYATKVRANNFTMLGSNPSGNNENSESTGSSPSYSRMSENAIPQGIAANETDDLPF